MKDILTLYTAVQPALLKQTLFKGFKLALIGIFLIVISGIWLGKEQLREWGFLIFIGGIGLITAGLLPYRRLSLLASKPNKLVAVGLDHLEFYERNRTPIKIPLSAIERMEFVEKQPTYGINVHLDGGKHCFLPYFSKRSFDELQAWIATDHTE